MYRIACRKGGKRLRKEGSEKRKVKKQEKDENGIKKERGCRITKKECREKKGRKEERKD